MNQKPNQSSVRPEEVVGFDADELLAKCGTILQREVRNLMIASTGRKLEAGEARDLVAYIKLLSDIRMGQQDELRSMSDEQLKKVVK